MLFTFLQTNLAVALAWIVAIFLALTVHEFSHALVGKLCGDRTAEDAGRLTLNPLAHIDLWGLIALLFVGFGWAKPVPFNPYNLKNPKWDSVKIALAGPVSNLLLSAISALILHFILSSGVIAPTNLLVVFLFFLVLLNLFLMFFNIIPVHPLDGSKLFFALFDHPKYARLREFVGVRGPQILFALVIVAIITDFDVFFFISRPAFAVCGTLLGGSCEGFFSAIFSL